jgi:hypothetical protein
VWFNKETRAMLPYSLDLSRLSDAYAQGVLTPEQVVRDIHAAMPQHADNPVWINLVPEADV